MNKIETAILNEIEHRKSVYEIYQENKLKALCELTTDKIEKLHRCLEILRS